MRVREIMKHEWIELFSRAHKAEGQRRYKYKAPAPPIAKQSLQPPKMSKHRTTTEYHPEALKRIAETTYTYREYHPRALKRFAELGNNTVTVQDREKRQRARLLAKKTEDGHPEGDNEDHDDDRNEDGEKRSDPPEEASEERKKGLDILTREINAANSQLESLQAQPNTLSHVLSILDTAKLYAETLSSQLERDCPHREKIQYGGDINADAPSGMLSMSIPALIIFFCYVMFLHCRSNLALHFYDMSAFCKAVFGKIPC